MLPVYYLYVTCILPVCYLYITCMLPVYYLYITCMLPVYYLYVTCVLPVCYLYITYHTQVDAICQRSHHLVRGQHIQEVACACVARVMTYLPCMT